MHTDKDNMRVLFVIAVLFIPQLPCYGELHFAIYSDEFKNILPEDPTFELLAKSDEPYEFHEGPAYFPDDNDGFLLYTTQPAKKYKDPKSDPQNSIKKYDIRSGELSTFRESSVAHMPNGQVRDTKNRLLTCEQGYKNLSPGRITRTNLSTGKVEVLVDSHYGLHLNSPNDIVVKSDGTIWFTDPSYGFMQDFRSKPELGDFVYRLDPDAKGPNLTVVADGFNKPNGLAFSPDEHYLYITESGAIQLPGSWHPNLPHHIYRYHVVNGRHLRNKELFAVVGNQVHEGDNPGIPDGIKFDQCGYVYVGAGDGVQVFNTNGDLIGKILTPTFVSNIAFGGKRGNYLYLLANSVLYRVRLRASGAEFSRNTEIQQCGNASSTLYFNPTN
uniref:Gluconolactonase-like protein 053 n=1 Tax=Saccoglossus kowalevskii TaxID=10224 RepID=A0A1L7H7G7_SACKO|nr:gluconolactonase-like protein 053 [Saccoglossus kowalevskii]